MTKVNAFEVVSLQAAAGAKLTVDEPAVALGGTSSSAQDLVNRFSFRAVQVLQGDPFSWMASFGEWKRGDRGLKIYNAMGGSRDLSVMVDGDSAAAGDLLDAVWKALNQGRGGAPPKLEDRGLLYHLTTAVVRLPKAFTEFFPPARVLRDAAREALERAGLSPPTDPAFRFSIDVTSAWSGLSVPLEVRFEPRVGTKSEDRVFFTSSPLRSEEHLALLERLCGDSRLPRQPSSEIESNDT